jgi:hypothetical protein
LKNNLPVQIIKFRVTGREDSRLETPSTFLSPQEIETIGIWCRERSGSMEGHSITVNSRQLTPR